MFRSSAGRTLRSLMVAISLATTALVGFDGLSGWSPANAQADVQRTVRLGPGESIDGRRVTLHQSKSMVIELSEDVRDVLVSNPRIADAVVRTNRRIFIIGQTLGTTNVFLFGANGRQIGSVEVVVSPDMKGLEAMLRRVLRNDTIRVEYTPQTIILSGEVRDQAEASRAYDIAAGFVGVASNTSSSGSSDSSGSSGSSGGSGDSSSGGSQSGSGGGFTLVSNITVKGRDQVLLKVTVAEVQRNAVKQLGVDLRAATLAAVNQAQIINNYPFIRGGTGGALTSNGYGVNGSAPNNAFFANGTIGNHGFEAVLRALEQQGVLRTLAEPTITAISGEKAKFLVGGEFPMVVGVDDDTVRIEYKQYGVALEFLPVVLADGRISIKVMTEVSELAAGYNTGGQLSNIPPLQGLRVRRADSTLELPSGGSMVLGGLIRDEVRQQMEGTPGLMNLPILGNLFRSRDFKREQTELAIFVTPYIVKPVAPKQLTRPDEGLAIASDAQNLFLGQITRRRAGGSVPGSYNGHIGFIYE
jgi:pilus assembly protein CpaC